MMLKDITSPDHILAAIAEHDQLGRQTFLENYGFAPSRSYQLIQRGKRYDSKAIIGVAHKYARPDLGPLHASEFSGGRASVERILTSLGFDVAVDHALQQQYFNSVLADIGLSPKDVVLLKHKDTRSGVTRSPFELWRHARPDFEIYQSTQETINRAKLARPPYWASFVVNPEGETIFAGLYNVRFDGLLKEDRPYVHAPGRVDKAGTCDVYETQYNDSLAALEGELIIEWGKGARAWIQRADLKNKLILRSIEPRSALSGLSSQTLAEDLAEIEASNVSPTTKRLKSMPA